MILAVNFYLNILTYQMLTISIFFFFNVSHVLTIPPFTLLICFKNHSHIFQFNSRTLTHKRHEFFSSITLMFINWSYRGNLLFFTHFVIKAKLLVAYVKREYLTYRAYIYCQNIIVLKTLRVPPPKISHVLLPAMVSFPSLHLYMNPTIINNKKFPILNQIGRKKKNFNLKTS